jgi:two-component system cell cycle response regulator DivK
VKDTAVADAKQPLVLIVEDNARNLKLARDVLRAGGLRTLEAETGEEGIAIAGEQLPDVILLDLGLPDIDGVEVARRLAGSPRTSAIPVVALSALGAEHDLGVGFAGYLEKPIDITIFPDQVRRYCS